MFVGISKVKFSVWINLKFNPNSKPLLSVLPTFLIKVSERPCPGGRGTLANKSFVSLL